MGRLKTCLWTPILVYMLLLQCRSAQVQGVDPVSQKLRRLSEQFQQFKALTQARLDMLNQNRNSSEGLWSRVQTLSDHWNRMSQDLEQFKQSTIQEIVGLREWGRKLEKKSKRMQGRLAVMERNIRENRRAQKQKSGPGQDFFNLTLEFQSQEERLAALQAQRDELLLGLRGLQESLKNQALRVNRVEKRLEEGLQVSREKNKGSWSSNTTPQEYYEPHSISPTHRGRSPGEAVDGQTPHRPGDTSYSQTDDRSQGTAQSRNPSQRHQYLATPTWPRQSESHKQTHYLPLPDPDHPQVQGQQLQSGHHHTRVQPPASHQRNPQVENLRYPSWHQAPPQGEPTKDRQSRIRLEAPHRQTSDALPQPQSESYRRGESGWDGGHREESDSKGNFSVIHNLLQLPVRHKIPAQPVPIKDATICNVESMLIFPMASAENYVSFSQTLPVLPELSVCLWLRVDASHVGTLLSYATDDNDNHLVLYGRNTSFPVSSLTPSHSFHSSSPSSLDFVIGDPAYRRLDMSSLLDARWHHLCVIWSSIQGYFWHYGDGRLISSGSNFRKGWEIPGGGTVVLGQEQDAVGGGFDPAEGFAGQVAGFRLWKRVLSPSEVKGMAGGRGVPRGVVLDMDDIKGIHGDVQQVACECLEHCVSLIQEYS